MSKSWVTGQKPKNQFSRPGVDLDREKRSWKALRAEQVQVGDTIPDWGIVEDIRGGQPFVAMTLVFVSGKTWVLPRDFELPMVFAQ